MELSKLIPEPIRDLQALEIRRHRRVWKPFMQKYDCKKVAELGVFAGQNFRRMIVHNPEVAVAVDVWKYDKNIARCDSGFSQTDMDKLLHRFKYKVMGLPFVQIVRKYTFDAVRDFPDEYFDLICIDADHTYEGCKRDMEDWYPKLKRGRFFTGDDYTNRRASRTGLVFGVVRAVDEFATQNHLQVYRLPQNGWAIIKP